MGWEYSQSRLWFTVQEAVCITGCHARRAIIDEK